jgi:hypothetical protein
MSWVTIIWSMAASACFTMAALNLVVWWKQRTVWANLLFCMTAVGVGVFAYFELAMMRAQSPADFATALRWGHVPLWLITVSLVWFMRSYLHAGRLWLAWTICALRTFSLLLNFTVGQNVKFLEVQHLVPIPRARRSRSTEQ